MAIRKINPTSPGQRGMTKSDYQEITTSTPEKSLLKSLKKTAGRNYADGRGRAKQSQNQKNNERL